MGGLKRVSERRTDALAETGWQQVETLLAVYYRGRGYTVEHCGTGASRQRFDGGVDLRLRKADECILVQVKHWNACKVPHNDVHQLLGVMVNEGATGAIVITSGEFTAAAIEAATWHGHVQLIDGAGLREMLGPVAATAIDADPVARADQVALAAHGRPAARPRPSAASATRAERNTTLLWWSVAVLGAVLFVVLVRGVLEKTRWTAGSTADRTDTLQAPPVASEPFLDEVREPRSAAGGTTVDACAEMIDQPSGIYIDHCAPSRPPAPPSKAEIRQQQRRADEAIKVLEATTPEMQ